jgi:predicted membrane protein
LVSLIKYFSNGLINSFLAFFLQKKSAASLALKLKECPVCLFVSLSILFFVLVNFFLFIGQRYNLFYINKLLNRIIYKVINNIDVKKPIHQKEKPILLNEKPIHQKEKPIHQSEPISTIKDYTIKNNTIKEKRALAFFYFFLERLGRLSSK